jgi:uncharacterized damage-inducible protein DinB
MRKFYLLGLALLVSVLQVSLYGQDATFVKEYLERMENSKAYLILVAEAVPEEQYSFRATPESMNFAEHLMHIVWAMDWHSQSLMGGREARNWETDTELKVADKSREEMIQTVARTFDITMAFIADFDTAKLDERLDYFGLDRTKRQVLLLLADHITHHRAQMLVQMRLMGIQPPRYVLYQ